MINNFTSDMIMKKRMTSFLKAVFQDAIYSSDNADNELGFLATKETNRSEYGRFVSFNYSVLEL